MNRPYYILGIIFFVLSSQFSNAQKTKTIDICDGPYKIYFLKAIIKYQESTPVDTTFVVFGRNHKYQTITDLITLKAGSFNEVWNFFTYCSEFISKEDGGTSETYQGNYITVNEMMGMKGLMVFGQGTDASGYTGFSAKHIDKLLGCMEDWEQKK